MITIINKTLQKKNKSMYVIHMYFIPTRKIIMCIILIKLTQICLIRSKLKNNETIIYVYVMISFWTYAYACVSYAYYVYYDLNHFWVIPTFLPTHRLIMYFQYY